MRVVSGEFKGRPLKSVPGNTTRPTTDKVKESIYNMIGPYFSGGTVLDLFAGSGGLGIEAISRGMDKGIFVDREFKAIQTIRQNLDACKVSEDQYEVYKNDSERALKALVKRELVFDLIVLDPPYKKQKLIDILSFIEEHKLLTVSGYIVCEHGSDIVLPEEVGALKQTRNETYGMIGISIYQISNGIEHNEVQ
ncbi:16S rRNA (guanine(966)-N(2))-methyltransferase RsmD [Peribacillus alkalitolerans]|uniref:16S rRNA (guanine(966)-N(2))-methyltransferase RsmD n=1 Tax=Peribacillus alkalitolerans TaxID=1550385 RepID=UPI0013D5CC3D|nr:16S rRNA (guanine(966)-N(2))-methyltransferase RsmD [Peribacillus alkalitolerans]